MSFEVMSESPDRRVELAISDIAAGRMVILVDDEDRENEGDLVIATEKITADAINFMATHARGLICLTLTEARVDHLGLPMMATNNRSPFSTAFTVSIEAREGVSTGISAADRARTCLVAIEEGKGSNDLVTPGHVFPLRARDGGVLVRTGQTEGSVDLARLAGLTPSGVICEIMNADGTMARLPELKEFGLRHGIRIVAVADLIRWRLTHERLVNIEIDTTVATPDHGEFRARIYRATGGGLHLALARGDLSAPGPVLTRVQTACGPADVFKVLTSDSAAQIDAALAAIAKEGRGVLLYLHIDGGDEGSMIERLREHLTPELTAPKPPNALRELGTGAQILVDLGVRELRLLTNNPRKIVGLEGFGLHVVERVPLAIAPHPDRRRFLESRRTQLGHLLGISGAQE
ncbi:riboflavin biosynthesis protein RibBA [Deltaproteobacteria bacterium]|nr:riboflavin biosynthesis protein RibBA [Deltaproteobacteria bacterium]